MKKSTHVAAFVGAGLGALVGTYFGVKALVAYFITFGMDLANLVGDKPEKCADDKQMPKSDKDLACNSCDSEKQDNEDDGLSDEDVKQIFKEVCLQL